MFDLIIFDCDGVLVDSEPVANHILWQYLSAHGLTLTYEETVGAFTGLSMTNVIGKANDMLGHSLPDNFLDQLQAETFDAFRRELHAIPHVHDLLLELQEKGRDFCVASSGTPEKMELTLGLTGLLPLFEGRLFSAIDVANGKPAPDLFLHAARSMRADPGRCAVIEDSVPGIRAARAAGMTAFGYAARGQDASLAREGARVFGDMSLVCKLLQVC